MVVALSFAMYLTSGEQNKRRTRVANTIYDNCREQNVVWLWNPPKAFMLLWHTRVSYSRLGCTVPSSSFLTERVVSMGGVCYFIDKLWWKCWRQWFRWTVPSEKYNSFILRRFNALHNKHKIFPYLPIRWAMLYSENLKYFSYKKVPPNSGSWIVCLSY